VNTDRRIPEFRLIPVEAIHQLMSVPKPEAGPGAESPAGRLSSEGVPRRFGDDSRDVALPLFQEQDWRSMSERDGCRRHKLQRSPTQTEGIVNQPITNRAPWATVRRSGMEG